MSKAEKKPTDAELLARYAKGDEDAFLKRFLTHQDLIDDVFQETFMQLFNSRDSFDVSRPLRPWLFTIAANKAKDTLRKRQRKYAVSISSIADAQEMSFDEVLNSITADETRPYEELQKGEIAGRVRSVIADMPENLREILILSYFNKFSYKQMSQILSIPIGTVKSRLHTALARFAKDWKAFTGGDGAK